VEVGGIKQAVDWALGIRGWAFEKMYVPDTSGAVCN
jgi:hypothetical protein